MFSCKQVTHIPEQKKKKWEIGKEIVFIDYNEMLNFLKRKKRSKMGTISVKYLQDLTQWGIDSEDESKALREWKNKIDRRLHTES